MSTSSEQVILALRELNSKFAASNRAVGAVLGIKDSDLAVLDALNQHGPQTPTGLAHTTTTHLATMTGILNRLERDGWIDRRPADGDRRSIEIHSTGVNRLSTIYAKSNERLTDLVDGWPAGQAATIARFLSQVSDAVSDLTEELRHAAELEE